jgi:hypothetical protein
MSINIKSFKGQVSKDKRFYPAMVRIKRTVDVITTHACIVDSKEAKESVIKRIQEEKPSDWAKFKVEEIDLEQQGEQIDAAQLIEIAPINRTAVKLERQKMTNLNTALYNAEQTAKAWEKKNKKD